MSTIYYISGGRDQKWFATKAKTVAGAKRVATRTYQVARGGKIEVGANTGESIDCVYDVSASIDCIAVKHGYNAWRDYV